MNTLLLAGPYLIVLAVGAALGGLYSALFLVCFGVFSNIILMLKNVNMIISPLFEVIDAIETVINKSIDQLQEDVCDEINKIFGHAAGPILSRIVNDAIDKAQHELSPRKRLPCPL